ncbi:MAG: hypothetical protein JXR10_17460 [Cyclobacteriaceae bacterium]
MKLLIRIILIISLTYFASMYSPWWIIIIISGLVSFGIYGSGFNVFISGFLGGGILWLTTAWFLDFSTNGILSDRIIQLFPLEDPFMLILITGLIGGLAAGLGAITGNSFRLLFVKKKVKGFYN